MRTCLHALAAGNIPTMRELLHKSEPSFERGPQNLTDTWSAATHCCIQRPNHSSMTPSQTKDFHQLNGMTHWTQQWVDSDQERFSIGLFHLALAGYT